MHNDLSKNSASSNAPQSPLQVSIVGARGYSGLELARILLKHPNVLLTKAFATQSFQLSSEVWEANAKRVQCLPDSELMQNLTDVVFLATPAEISAKLAPQILSAGKKVIDLSGAFRLKHNDLAKWYSIEQFERKLLDSAEYGLVPFCGPFQQDTTLIANPGCYATAIQLALVPLIRSGLIETDFLVIDAKSGTTGAGKKASENLLYSEIEGNCLPYRVGRHQHLPEIQESIQAFTGHNIDPHFTTHLLPTKRGIIVGLYAKTSAKNLAQITEAYATAFANYPLVRYGTDIPRLASLSRVVGTPYTHISYEIVGGKLYLFSCLDNLLKGAASQAVENLNRMMDWPVSLGLKDPKELS